MLVGGLLLGGSLLGEPLAGTELAGTVTVTVGRLLALDEPAGAGLGGELGRLIRPPSRLVPEPCLPLTVADSGCPEASSKPVVAASTSRNSPPAANASRRGLSAGNADRGRAETD